MNEYNFSTKVVNEYTIQQSIHPIVGPIYTASTYILESAEHGAKLANLEDPEDKSPFLYSRWKNPTTDSTAKKLAILENGFGCHLTGSGMAAITTALFSQLKAGDHVIAPKPVYGGTHEVFAKVLPKYGIEVSWADLTDIDTYRTKIKENTKLIYGESPANPNMSLVDLKALAQLAKEFNCISMVDSTFGSPYIQQPINHGIDIVVHSATKYLGGHSDIIAGAIIVNSEKLHQDIFQTIKLFGGILSPFDAYLLGRGIKTLDVRMERHNKNALSVAKYLEDHDKVSKVYYPGLASHPQHQLAKSQMNGFGGMIAFEVNGGLEAGKTVIENLNLITLAVSLGGVESLIEQ
ncbi:MAG: aminotransferase class I/II-fold pyridoxal phosphate-dependent enzyme, partial [Candidatus Heimdallarchaeota archaeon]|nr:aminotransferase class I/II-fold pyridoxal phosphate-dependent enzyme [Candidatus Heimdallarchaeota archaeon]